MKPDRDSVFGLRDRVGVVCARWPTPPVAVTSARRRRGCAGAIARGVAYLKEPQEDRGHWSFSFNHDHTLGITALAGLALLENGVDARDPAIGKATEVVRSLSAAVGPDL